MQVVCNLVLIFREPSAWHTIKTTVSNFTILTQIYAQFYLFRKGSGNNFSTTLCLCFSCYTLLIDQTSLSDCLYLLRYRAICVLPLFVSKGSDVINFETKLIFLIKPFLHCTEKSRQKFKYVEKKKIASILKGFQLPKIVPDLRVCL